MKKQLIGALIGLSTLMFGSAVNAATVDASFDVTSGFQEQIFTVDANVHYYELNVGDYDVSFIVSLIDTIVDGHSVAYSLYQDLTAAADEITIGAMLANFSAADNVQPTTTVWALQALGHYVLAIDANPGTLGVVTSVSAVPLPGAALLFGSALFGAGMFGRKNKASKNNNFAAVAA